MKNLQKINLFRIYITNLKTKVIILQKVFFLKKNW